MQKQIMLKIIVAALSLVMIISGCGGSAGSSSGAAGTSANSITLAWDPPNTNTDGTSLTDLAGYKVYYKKVSDSDFIQDPVIIDDPQRTTCTITLPPGEYYFIVKAYDTSGNDSLPSNECPPEGTPAKIPR